MKYLFFCLCLLTGPVYAQTRSNIGNLPRGEANPFVFSENTLTGRTPYWNLSYRSDYGRDVKGALGFDGIGQNFALKGYIGHRFTVLANLGVGFEREGQTQNYQ